MALDHAVKKLAAALETAVECALARRVVNVNEPASCGDFGCRHGAGMRADDAHAFTDLANYGRCELMHTWLRENMAAHGVDPVTAHRQLDEDSAVPRRGAEAFEWLVPAADLGANARRKRGSIG